MTFGVLTLLRLQVSIEFEGIRRKNQPVMMRTERHCVQMRFTKRVAALESTYDSLVIVAYRGIQSLVRFRRVTQGRHESFPISSG